MSPAQVEAIERATVAAVSPQATEEIAGWLLPFDTGTVVRSKSAVPLTHAAPDASALGEIEARYARRGAVPILRLPTVASFDAMRDGLRKRGWTEGKPTLVRTASADDMLRVTTQPPAATAPRPDAAWAAIFTGEGFDPVDGASRVANLSRAPGALFASVREGDATVAAGMGAYSHAWGSVHGMRTAQSHRGRGLAGRVLAALAQEAIARGMPRMFLQVEEGNAAANALYTRAGFRTAWTYTYWTPKQ